MKAHQLKTLPEYFAAVRLDKKPFEVRRNDRDFKEGDLLILREWDGQKYTGEKTGRIVSYALHGGQFGIEPGFVVLGLNGLTMDQLLTMLEIMQGESN